MTKIAYVFLSLCLIPTMGFCGIGLIDKRTYPAWNTLPYSNYVQICSGGGCGTGEFITPRHILTNKHVAKCCGINSNYECSVRLSDGTKKYAKVIETGGGISNCQYKHEHLVNGQDWSIIEILDTNFYHTYFTITSTITGNGFSRAGFGGLKVLTNDDVKNIKIAYEKWLKKVFPYNFMNRKEVASLGANLEYGNYSILDGSGIPKYKSTVTYKTFFDEFKRLTGKDFYNNYLNDDRLKLISPCAITTMSTKSIDHTCDGWHGDSGSAILVDKKTIIGLDNSGYSYIGATKKAGTHNWGVPIHSEIIDAILRVKKQRTNPKPESTLKPTPKPSPEPKPRPKPQPNEHDIGDACAESHLPPHATAGYYIKSGIKKYDCANGQKCSCAATECESGYYLVVNVSGNSQGWCYTRRCPSGQHLNIVDGYKTDTKCVDD